MRTALLAVLLALCCSACSKRHDDATIKTATINNSLAVSNVYFPSPALGDVLSYRAIIPAHNNGERLPVLYLLHGANSSPAEVMARSDVTRLAAAGHLAVVIPDGKFSYYTNAKHKRHAQWEDAITSDLMNDVGTRFPVLTGRQHTGVAGFSMGGYGAAKLSLKHPDLYGFVGIMSGALDITRRPPSLRRWGQTWRIWTVFGLRPSARRDEDVFALLNGSKPPQTAWFASCGKDDPLHGVGERFAHSLRQQGVEVRLVTTEGGHDWRSWNAAMPQMFKAAGAALR
jgi:S-formylglutathione hydrolase FrmB